MSEPPFFDIDCLKKEEGSVTDSSSSLCEKFISYHEQKIESVKKICNLPFQNEIYFLWTDHSFNAFTFIPYTIKQEGSIDELIISTYSINQRIIDSLMKYYKKGLIHSIKMVVSDSLRYRMPKVVDIMEALVINEKNITVSYGWNHSKITLMNCGTNFYVVEGSGNWSENSRNEQYVLLNNSNVFNFRKNCIYGITG